jgi:hypothetical protein
MRSEVFADQLKALVTAGVITQEQATRASSAYKLLRQREENEQDERRAELDKRLEDKPFDRLLFLRDPLLGVPVIFWALVAWLLVRGVW